MEIIRNALILISALLVQGLLIADELESKSMNASYKHFFTADNKLHDEATGLFNKILNQIPREKLGKLSKDYLLQLEDKQGEYLESQEKNLDTAVKQETAYAIQYYLQHQKVDNSRFVKSGNKVAGWCLVIGEGKCDSPLNAHGTLTRIKQGASTSGGNALVVGRTKVQTSILTSLQTIPGQTYTLSFSYTGDFVKNSGRSYIFRPVSTLVSIGAEETLIEMQHPIVEEEFWSGRSRGVLNAPWDNNQNGYRWEKVEMQFVATQSQTTLGFTYLDKNDNGQETTPIMLSNVMVYDDATADKSLQPGQIAYVATSGAAVAGVGGTILYLVNKGHITNYFQSLGYGLTTVGPGTKIMRINAAFDDMHEIMQGNGGLEVLGNYLNFTTREYAEDYFKHPIQASQFNALAHEGFVELDTGIRADALTFDESATYITKPIFAQSTDINVQTVIKFTSQQRAIDFVRHFNSYLMTQNSQVQAIRREIHSLNVLVGNTEANAVAAEHESVIVFHTGNSITLNGTRQISLNELVAWFAKTNGFKSSIVDSLPFTYSSTSVSGIGWSSIIEDINSIAANIIHDSYQAEMTVEEFSTAAIEAMEAAGILVML
ncbi:hypothetical protein [Vibrio sagamiensis]|nr:hypothetical protein [Vibrio sagamiensis]PNQ53991.1 hypothetical protein C1141_18280 [Vibrio agarivorans]